MFKRTRVFLLLLLSMLTTSCIAYVYESSTTRVEPSSDNKHLTLHCIKSSTGICYFIIGKIGSHTENTFTLAAESSLRIDAVSEKQPFCITGSKRSKFTSCENQFINPDGSITKIISTSSKK